MGAGSNRAAAIRHALSLIAAGFGTPATLIAHAVLLLDQNPDQLAALKADLVAHRETRSRKELRLEARPPPCSG